MQEQLCSALVICLPHDEHSLLNFKDEKNSRKAPGMRPFDRFTWTEHNFSHQISAYDPRAFFLVATFSKPFKQKWTFVPQLRSADPQHALNSCPLNRLNTECNICHFCWHNNLFLLTLTIIVHLLICMQNNNKNWQTDTPKTQIYLNNQQSSAGNKIR